MMNRFFRLLLVGVFLCPAACEDRQDRPPAASTAGAQHHAHMQLPAGKAISGQSVYLLESSWTSQDGRRLKLAEFAGKPVVLAMVYTHCDNACPRIIADMRLIRQQIDADRVGFALVSIDPGRDTVERLDAFGKETGLTAQGWSLLRGGEDDVRELAAVFGVQYRRTSETDFAHSNVINVLNRKGEIVHRQQGLGSRPDETIEVLKTLLRDGS